MYHAHAVGGPRVVSEASEMPAACPQQTVTRIQYHRLVAALPRSSSLARSGSRSLVTTSSDSATSCPSTSQPGACNRIGASSMKEMLSAARDSAKIACGAVATVFMYVTPNMNGPSTFELPRQPASAPHATSTRAGTHLTVCTTPSAPNSLPSSRPPPCMYTADATLFTAGVKPMPSVLSIAYAVKRYPLGASAIRVYATTSITIERRARVRSNAAG